jgi:putative peptidoglycan lipid II flippase
LDQDDAVSGLLGVVPRRLRIARARRGLLTSAVVVLGLAGLGKVAGFAREVVVAAQFGASTQTDGFFTAYALFNIVWVMALAASLAPALLPTLIQFRVRGEHRSERAAATLLVLATIGLGAIVTAIGWLGAEGIVQLTAPELVPGAAAVAADSLRLLSLATVPTVLAGTLGAILHSHDRFAAPATSTLVVSLAMVAATLTLAERFGVEAAALGVVAGSLIHLAILVPSLVSLRPLGPPVRGLGPQLLTAGRRTVPVTGLAALVSARPALERSSAAAFGTGLVTAVGLGSKTGSFFASLVGTALGTVVFPRLARGFASGDREQMRRTLRRAADLIAVMTVPVAAASLFLAGDISRLLFQHGEMTAEAAGNVAAVLVAYAPGVLLSPVVDVLGRVRYARGDTTTPLLAAGVGLLVNAAVLGLLDGIGLGVFGVGLTLNVIATLAVLFSRERELAAALVPSLGMVAAAVVGTASSLIVYALARSVVAERGGAAGLLGAGVAAAVVYLVVVVVMLRLVRRGS